MCLQNIFVIKLVLLTQKYMSYRMSAAQNHSEFCNGWVLSTLDNKKETKNIVITFHF